MRGRPALGARRCATLSTGRLTPTGTHELRSVGGSFPRGSSAFTSGGSVAPRRDGRSPVIFPPLHSSPPLPSSPPRLLGASHLRGLRRVPAVEDARKGIFSNASRLTASHPPGPPAAAPPPRIRPSPVCGYDGRSPSADLPPCSQGEGGRPNEHRRGCRRHDGSGPQAPDGGCAPDPTTNSRSSWSCSSTRTIRSPTGSTTWGGCSRGSSSAWSDGGACAAGLRSATCDGRQAPGERRSAYRGPGNATLRRSWLGGLRNAGLARTPRPYSLYPYRLCNYSGPSRAPPFFWASHRGTETQRGRMTVERLPRSVLLLLVSSHFGLLWRRGLLSSIPPCL